MVAAWAQLCQEFTSYAALIVWLICDAYVQQHPETVSHGIALSCRKLHSMRKTRPAGSEYACTG